MASEGCRPVPTSPWPAGEVAPAAPAVLLGLPLELGVPEAAPEEPWSWFTPEGEVPLGSRCAVPAGSLEGAAFFV